MLAYIYFPLFVTRNWCITNVNLLYISLTPITAKVNVFSDRCIATFLSSAGFSGTFCVSFWDHCLVCHVCGSAGSVFFALHRTGDL